MIAIVVVTGKTFTSFAVGPTGSVTSLKFSDIVV